MSFHPEKKEVMPSARTSLDKSMSSTEIQLFLGHFQVLGFNLICYIFLILFLHSDMKNTVRIETDNGPELVAKKGLYNNLRETYYLFLEKFPELENTIGLSKFAEFR